MKYRGDLDFKIVRLELRSNSVDEEMFLTATEAAKTGSQGIVNRHNSHKDYIK